MVLLEEVGVVPGGGCVKCAGRLEWTGSSAALGVGMALAYCDPHEERMAVIYGAASLSRGLMLTTFSTLIGRAHHAALRMR